jgi:hypothetical protein
MTKVRKVLIPKKVNTKHQIEFAVRADGSYPASEALEELRKNAWPNGVVQLVDPHDRPADAFYHLMSRLEHFSKTGRPRDPKAMNGLEDGIYEFKAIKIRFPFFEVDANDQIVKKKKNASQSVIVPMEPKGSWEIPNFEMKIRLTHCFAKDAQKTRPAEIKTAKAIRDEDLAHA